MTVSILVTEWTTKPKHCKQAAHIALFVSYSNSPSEATKRREEEQQYSKRQTKEAAMTVVVLIEGINVH